MQIPQWIFAFIVWLLNYGRKIDYADRKAAQRWDMLPPVYPPLKQRMEQFKKYPWMVNLIIVPLWFLIAGFSLSRFLIVLVSWLFGFFTATVVVFLGFLETGEPGNKIKTPTKFWKLYDKPTQNWRQLFELEEHPGKLIGYWPMHPLRRTTTESYLEMWEKIRAIPGHAEMTNEELAEAIGEDVRQLYRLRETLRTGQLWYSKEHYEL